MKAISKRVGRCAATVSLCCVIACLHGVVEAQEPPTRLAGQRLESALRTLQGQGLRLVFSTELVTPDMRVREEPDARTLRGRLDQLLAPHNLQAEDGPGGVILVVRAHRVPTLPGRSMTPAARPQGESRDPDSAVWTFRERVDVVAPSGLSPAWGAGSDVGGGATALNVGPRALADDPLRAVQSWPRVTAVNELRSGFSVRGSVYRHVGTVIDGIATTWLQHLAAGRAGSGAVSMFGTNVISSATLRVGGFPRRHEGSLDGQLDLTLRDGPREGHLFGADVSGTGIRFTAEGPLGYAGRGSWLVSVRRSYVEWPIGRSDHGNTVFGFADVQTRLSYDISRTQQLSATLVAGQSEVERDDPNPRSLGDGRTRASLVNLAWTSTPGPRTTLTQRVGFLTRDFDNRNQRGDTSGMGADRAGLYRVDAARTFGRWILESGGEVRRVTGARHTAADVAGLTVASSWWNRSAYAHAEWRPSDRLMLGGGARIADMSGFARPVLDRWVSAEWVLAPEWKLHGAMDLSHQFPDVDDVGGWWWSGPTTLRPERTAHVEVGVGQRLGAIRWDGTFFARRERDVLARSRTDDVGFDNGLAGSARGVELLVERRADSGVSGWIAYALGFSGYRDVVTGERFRGDLDQRHALTAVARYRLPGGTVLTASYRAGSRLPGPRGSSGRPVASVWLPGGRLPAYSRLDAGAEHTFAGRKAALTLFAEVVNVLNRTNIGPVYGVALPASSDPVNLVERLYPRLVTGGVRIVF